MIDICWMVPPGSRIAHAFRAAELRAGPTEVTAVRFCGTWPITRLTETAFAERCRACEHAIEKSG
jgi:hypothetical protein